MCIAFDGAMQQWFEKHVRLIELSWCMFQDFQDIINNPKTIHVIHANKLLQKSPCDPLHVELVIRLNVGILAHVQGAAINLLPIGMFFKLFWDYNVLIS